MIKENATGATVRVCRGGKRKRHVYTSTTNSIEIHFVEQIGNEMEISYFVMEYEGILIWRCIITHGPLFIICYICNINFIRTCQQQTRTFHSYEKNCRCFNCLNCSHTVFTSIWVYWSFNTSPCSHTPRRGSRYSKMSRSQRCHMGNHMSWWTMAGTFY